MIRHIVMWKLKDQAEVGTRAENGEKMRALLGICRDVAQGTR